MSAALQRRRAGRSTLALALAAPLVAPLVELGPGRSHASSPAASSAGPAAAGAASPDGALPRAEAARLRELLAAALAGDAKAARKLADAAQTLRAKYDHASLVAALRQGPALPRDARAPRGKGKAKEQLVDFGAVTTGFTFAVGDEVFRYAVDVPEGYDPEVPAPVVLDPGHGAAAREDQEGKAGYLGYFRNQARAAGLPGALVVRTELVEQLGADGLAGARPEDEVCAAFDAFFRDLASRFAVDLDRVWVTGLSQTGFWAWQLGLTRPDRYAGIAPMGAVTWGTRGYLEDLAPVAVHVLHGAEDPICPVAQPRATTKALEQLGVRVRYVEVPGGKHDFSTWGRLHEGLAWLAERPRDPYPRRVVRHLQTGAQPWCHWVRVDAMKKGGAGKAGQPPLASLEAVVDGQEVRLTTDGVKALTLCLSSELVDLDQPVVVVWNGARKHDAVVARDFTDTVALAVEKVDWRGTFDARIALKE